MSTPIPQTKPQHLTSGATDAEGSILNDVWDFAKGGFSKVLTYKLEERAFEQRQKLRQLEDNARTTRQINYLPQESNSIDLKDPVVLAAIGIVSFLVIFPMIKK
jgi:hypothetical protein